MTFVHKALVVTLLLTIVVLGGCGTKDTPSRIDITQGSTIQTNGSSESVPLQGGFVPQ